MGRDGGTCVGGSGRHLGRSLHDQAAAAVRRARLWLDSGLHCAKITVVGGALDEVLLETQPLAL